MPERALIANELAKLLGVLAHPQRIRIIEELRGGEMDVNSLQAVLGVSHSRVSQNLSLLRSYRLVVERRQGRHVFYQLAQPQLANWILDGLQFLEAEAALTRHLAEAVQHTRRLWSVAPEQGSQAAQPNTEQEREPEPVRQSNGNHR